jgi:hypothetical protein
MLLRAAGLVCVWLLLGVRPLAAQVAVHEPDGDGHQHGADAIELFPSRDASGTALVPDDTPMEGIHTKVGGWQVMLHGVLFGQIVIEPGAVHRTGGNSTHQVSSVNWGMLVARRAAGAGRLGLRTMLSAERWTVSDCGFINFFATGEMCEGDTIHDRQHPHDVFMEIAADYERRITSAVRWQIYGGLAGEPALGPPGFPHRLSAAIDPAAPIGHHWIDSTHVSYGVITTGLATRRLTVEGSLFNAREPDENRTDLDLGPLDSFSGRVSFLASPRLAIQMSAGHLESAEAQFAPDPRTDIERVSVSVTVNRAAGDSGYWATTAAYGLSSSWILSPGAGVKRVSHALLVESSRALRGGHTVFGRIEAVGKPAHDLHLDAFPARVLPTAKLQGGYVREWPMTASLTVGVGGTAALSRVPEELVPRYERRTAVSIGTFVVVRPRHRM